MPHAISPQLRTYIQDRLPGGLDDQEIADIAAKVSASATPVVALTSILAEYGDDFTLDGAKAFNVAATIVGDRDLGQLGTAFQATKESISGVRGTLSELTNEISRLESENKTKASEVDSLVNQISSRKSEIESSRRRKRRTGILGAMLGVPAVAVVSLSQMWDDDARLKSLNSSLEKAKKRQTEIDDQMHAFEQSKTVLGTQLKELKKAEKSLGSTLDVGEPSLPRNMVQVADAAKKLERRQKLLINLKQQVTVLEGIRDAAKAVGVNLDQLIDTLHNEVKKADKMVAESEKALMDLIKIATGPNPGAAAEKWLNKRVANRTAKVLDALKLDVKKYVSHLVREAFPGGGDAAKSLQKQLTKSLLATLPR